jgi:hypothetical protein
MKTGRRNVGAIAHATSVQGRDWRSNSNSTVRVSIFCKSIILYRATKHIHFTVNSFGATIKPILSALPYFSPLRRRQGHDRNAEIANFPAQFGFFV